MDYDNLSKEKLIEALETMETELERERNKKQEFEELAKKNKADLDN